MRTPDAQLIAHALRGRKSGACWMVRCPAHDDTTPSLSIRDTEDGRVLVKCHAGCQQTAVLDALRVRGLWSIERSLDWKCHEARPAPKRAEPSAESRTAFALRIWTEAQDAGSSPVDRYLKQRRILITAPGTLRFHRALKHPSGHSYPAMVALVVDHNRQPIGVHRTFLDQAGTAKAQVSPNKMMLGPCRGGAVRLGPLTSPLLVGEGIETCLAGMQATGLTAWAALSTAGMVALVLPRDIDQIIILADGDAPGERAALTAAERWASHGHRVRIARPPVGFDFNDVLLGVRMVEGA